MKEGETHTYSFRQGLVLQVGCGVKSQVQEKNRPDSPVVSTQNGEVNFSATEELLRSLERTQWDFLLQDSEHIPLHTPYQNLGV